jgi:hypothetical protein
MVATVKPTYGNATGATVLIAGNHVEIADADIASATAAPVVHFNNAFVFHYAGSPMSWSKGQTVVVTAGLKTALVAAGAPISVIQ